MKEEADERTLVIASEAKQSRAIYATLDCFASLAMTIVSGDDAQTRRSFGYILSRRPLGRIARRSCGAAHPARPVLRATAVRGDRGEHRAWSAARLGTAPAAGEGRRGRTPRISGAAAAPRRT